jgi:uncharacterized protein (DUF2252 family)
MITKKVKSRQGRQVRANQDAVHKGPPEIRAARGRTQRESLSRSVLGELEVEKRKVDVVGILKKYEANRVPELIPEKYQRMSVSPFAFFRGSVGLMVADFQRLPHTDITVQLGGDAHVQNLGSFAGPDGRLVFDMNDFDETHAGPWEWDVKRMGASLVLAGRESGHGRSGCSLAVETMVSTYRAAVAELACLPLLVAARTRTHLELDAEPLSAAIQQSRRALPLDLIAKYTTRDLGGRVIFKDTPPNLRRATESERKALIAALPAYRKSLPPDRRHMFDFFEATDAAFKIVGTGSVGTRDWVVLMFGNGIKDPLFLQVKQEVESAYTSALWPSLHDHQGQRVVDGQHRIQAFSDLLLGWTTIGPYQYVVRQLNDHKGSVDLQNLRGDGLRELAAAAGTLLGHGHGRSGDAIELLGYLGNGEKVAGAITKFALGYANLVDADFKVFQDAIATGALHGPKPARKTVNTSKAVKRSAAKASTSPPLGKPKKKG